MRLLNLVKEQNAVGLLLDKAGQCARFCALIALFKANEAHVGLMVRKTRHIEALEGDSQRFRRLFGEEGFAYARRPCKHEYGARPLALLVGCGQDLCGKHTLCEGMHHMILTMDGRKQLGAHVLTDTQHP